MVKSLKRIVIRAICLTMLAFILYGSINGYADNDAKIKLNEAVKEYDVTSVMLVLEDKDKELSGEDMLDPRINDRFVLYKDSKLAGSISDSAYWVKAIIENGTDEVQNIFLDISKPHLNNLSLYRFDHSKLISEMQTGRDYSFGQRAINHRNFVFEITMLPETEETIFIRVDTKSYFQLPVKLYTSRAFVEKDYTTQLFLGIYYGIMLAMFLYNLVLYMALKDKVYLFYIFYILGFSLVQLVWDGLAFQFLWPDAPVWDVRSNPVLIIFTSYFVLQFSRSFLHVGEKSRLADRIISYMLVLLAVIGALAFVIPPATALKLSVYSATAAIVMCIGNIWIVGFHNKSVYLYSISWAALFIGVSLNIAAAYRFLPINAVTLYSPRVGSAVEAVLLSLALVNRFNRIKQEKLIEQKQKVLLKSLHEITKTLTSTQELDILLKYILRSLSELTKNENGIIILKQDRQYVVKDSLGYDEIGLKNKVLEELEEDKSFNRILREDIAVTLMNVEMDRYGINITAKTFTGIPIIYHESLLGLIVLYSMNSKEINYMENQIIYDFAGQVGISIQNLMLFDRVKKMATIDGLTGVFNRIHFTGMAELAFRELQKSNKNLSLVMMDIDNFKLVNDRYGHLVGDKVLQELVKCLKEVLGPNSIIGRYGGEEFLILLKETSIQEAYQIAEKTRNAVENLRVYLDNKEVVKFTISLGVSTTNKDISDIWSLVEKADRALYLSKENGKNLVNIC